MNGRGGSAGGAVLLVGWGYEIGIWGLSEFWMKVFGFDL